MLRYLLIIFIYTQQCLHRLAKRRRSRPISIVCIADTHSQQLPIPRGDVLIHAGDLTRSGKVSELRDAIAWLHAQLHAHKIVIAGNADLPLDPKINVGSDTDVVVTHMPPQFILDEWDASPQGCALLLREIGRVRPALHVFGHCSSCVWSRNCHVVEYAIRKPRLAPSGSQAAG